MVYHAVMIRTSLLFPEPLYQHLQLLASERKMALTEVVRELLTKALNSQEGQRLERIYQAFDAMTGAVNDTSIADMSDTIDDTLYGDQGAWRGDTNRDR